MYKVLTYLDLKVEGFGNKDRVNWCELAAVKQSIGTSQTMSKCVDAM